MRSVGSGRVPERVLIRIRGDNDQGHREAMAYRILIVGLRDRDAGKTSLATALLAYLCECGYSACGFKPRAGNSIWYDYDIVEESLSAGRLYGRDAKKLKLASGCEEKEEFINPFHRLWSEPPHIDPVTRIPYFIVDRITLWHKRSEPTNIVVVNDALPGEYRYDESLFQGLYDSATHIFHVRDLDTLNKLTSEYYDLAAELVFGMMDKSNDFIVIESYSDVALPYSGLNDLDAVIGIKPGEIRIYEPEKYLTAVQLEATIRTGELSTACIEELLKPVRVIKVPPFRSDSIPQELKKRVRAILEI